MVKLRIAIFEDNNDLRDSMSMIIDSVDEFELAGSYSNAQRLISKIDQSKPDVILMDIHMPGLSGIEATRDINARYPEIKILMQTVFDEDDKVFASLCAGASGYILKNTTPERMLQAIREVAKGGVFFTPAIASKVLMNFKERQSDAEFIMLTEREKEVLLHLVNGLQYREIADKIFLSYEAVHSHIKKIYEKLHVNSKSEAVVKAIRNKLV
ncbi:MAG TPA: response regulator transcription factor [Saprospiraceae bacterium]|nr:response regulator transcription factor [Saprospiraceae bacterium]